VPCCVCLSLVSHGCAYASRRDLRASTKCSRGFLARWTGRVQGIVIANLRRGWSGLRSDGAPSNVGDYNSEVCLNALWHPEARSRTDSAMRQQTPSVR
jgi:hypothetical protein